MKLLYNAQIVNEGRSYRGYVVVDGEFIYATGEGNAPEELKGKCSEAEDLDGLWLLPGVIDDQVHFRDPGLTHKGDIESESRAAVAGGVTSFMDMPNTKPQTTDEAALDAKRRRAADVSWANYSFFIGATNDNIEVLRNLDYSRVPGIKLFLGSSTGNMLVDREAVLDEIFSLPRIVAIHSEDEAIIRENSARARAEYGDDVPITMHPVIRSTEACYESTRKAVERARRLGTRLHVLHVSTAKELDLFNREPLSEKKITSEVCVHHLWFADDAYERLGARVKWNPAVKSAEDREALREAVETGLIDIVATDHAPHLPEEKQGGALKAASGGPMVQHSLAAMLEMFSPEKTVEVMCHKVAELYGIDKRGYIRPGYYADLAVVDPNMTTTVSKDNIFYKCGWSPIEGVELHHTVVATYVNGIKVYADGRHLYRGNPMELRYK